MFRCATGHTTEPGVKMIKLPIVTREVQYSGRSYVAQRRQHYDPGGVGVETVEEATLCPPCADAIRAEAEKSNLS